MQGRPVSQFFGAFQGRAEALSPSGVAQPEMVATTISAKARQTPRSNQVLFMTPDGLE
jgi:hypothetical protein